MTSGDDLGRVGSLWRFPVKSMAGEELTGAEVHEGGLVGDRAYAVMDVTDGRIATAKQPRKWGRLLDFAARFASPPRLGAPPAPVRIELPDGRVVASDDPERDRRLSEVLGRDVTLTARKPPAARFEWYWPEVEGVDVVLGRRIDDPSGDVVTSVPFALGAPPGDYFFDYAVVHLLTTATLDRLRALYPGGRFELPRFRPNVLVETAPGVEGFVENAWVGRSLAVGDVVLRATDPCARCVMTTLPQADLPADVGILRTIARHNTLFVPGNGKRWPCAGVFAAVVRGGVVRPGDRVRLHD